MTDLAKTVLLAAAIFNLAFVPFHLLFWRLFRWKEDLASLTAVNRGIMQVLNLCLIVVFGIMAYVTLFLREEMLFTTLGRTLLIGFSLFWFLRMVEQIIFFESTKLSRAFITIFWLGTALHLGPFLATL
jgi:hypothetical protein